MAGAGSSPKLAAREAPGGRLCGGSGRPTDRCHDTKKSAPTTLTLVYSLFKGSRRELFLVFCALLGLTFPTKVCLLTPEMILRLLGYLTSPGGHTLAID